MHAPANGQAHHVGRVLSSGSFDLGARQDIEPVYLDHHG